MDDTNTLATSHYVVAGESFVGFIPQSNAFKGRAAGGIAVIVVDDEAGRVDAICTHLRQRGFAPWSVLDDNENTSGHSEPFTLAVIDLAQREACGVLIAQEFRREWPDLDVVLLGSDTAEYAPGAQDFAVIRRLDPP